MKPKLTNEQVAEIQAQYRYGRRPKLIAAEFGISYHMVWKVTHGWRKGTQDSKESSTK